MVITAPTIVPLYHYVVVFRPIHVGFKRLGVDPPLCFSDASLHTAHPVMRVAGGVALYQPIAVGALKRGGWVD